MTVEQPIQPAPISKARHLTLGRKVLKNISTSSPFGVVDKSVGLRTPRRPKLSDKLAASIEANGELSEGKGAGPEAGPYDHWLLRRTARVRRICDDIPSKAVTNMFARGMIIDTDWLERGDPDWHPDWHEEDADGETDHGEEVPFEEAKPADDELPVLDVDMWDATHPQEGEQEAGPSRTSRDDSELAQEVSNGASGV
ncbi:uncharacterized protein PHACADRAFT_250738 [Phanerochaete carnosa HHB-10118-sp]|uniref:Uncharacterized protein n=1 Tax=Phanerochaete carnosa (strain HHB-10118-sp) TaxID=650164 RepID=K5WKK5_PHACS|nr:uncharacterized protein PHACADRAFT_250738 [Phanerochaete carnosa HHB-10118-sp]EKM59930.1 hypothetical protein PHACADRAFT_250738 [Phanerochaete carnosa HHB-10118-sp]